MPSAVAANRVATFSDTAEKLGFSFWMQAYVDGDLRNIARFQVG